VSAVALILATTTANKPATFLVLLVAQAVSWAGVPALGTAAMSVAGALASEGTLHLWAVLVVGTIGAEIGSLGGWWIGYRVARAGLDREGRFGERRRRALHAGQRVQQKWGRLIVFFVPSWVSGALGMPFRQFAFWNLFAALLWNIGAGLAAYGIGSAALGGSLFESLGSIVIAAAALGAIAMILVRRRRRRPETSSDRRPRDPDSPLSGRG
jgi:membrane protein DedA with SNARE-associated domain